MCSEYLHELTFGQNHLIHRLFYNNVLKISCELLNTGLKVKTGMLSEYRMVVKCLGRLLLHPPGSLGGVGHCRGPASQGSIIQYHWLAKGSKLEFEVQLLLNACCFCTIIRSENCESNHHKLGTICVKSLG